jgi:hypothetical protein
VFERAYVQHIVHRAPLFISENNVSPSSSLPVLASLSRVRTYTGYGLVIGFLDSLIQLVITLYRSLSLSLSLSHCHGLHHSYGNGFKRQRFPFLCVFELSPCLRHFTWTDSNSCPACKISTRAAQRTSLPAVHVMLRA